MEMILSTPTNSKYSIFLAGTIDCGNSEDWQTKVAESFIDYDVILYSPRKENWNDIDDDIYTQINWELDHLEFCDLIIMNLLPDSKSPISLLELGLFAKSDKLVVCCPKEFYRYHNVKSVCDRYSVPLYDNMDELQKDIIELYLK